MTKCPICQTETKKEYCPTCAWEFEYYFGELDLKSKAIYEDRFKIWSGIYSRLSDLEKNGLISSKTISNRLPFEPEMVFIKGDSFLMGTDDHDNEKPIHKVTIDYDFEIGKYPVTEREYYTFCDDFHITKLYPHINKNSNKPITDISWESANLYIQWLNKKTNKSYRLPTEAEWEFVARAGTRTKWSFGDDDNELTNYAWYRGNSYDKGREHPDYGIQEVGLKKANKWGIYDMYGHILEYCEDWSAFDYSKTPIDGSAQGQNKGIFSKKFTEKVLRGGSWVDNARLNNRYKSTVYEESILNGFRLIRTLS